MSPINKLPDSGMEKLKKIGKPPEGIAELAYQIRENKVTRKLEQTKLADLIEWPIQKARAGQVAGGEHRKTTAETEKRARKDIKDGKEVTPDPKQEPEESSRKKRRVQPSPNYPPADVQTPFKACSQAIRASGAFHVVQVPEFSGFRAFVQGQTASLSSPTYSPIKTTYRIPLIQTIPRISAITKPSSRSAAGLRYKPPSGTPSSAPKAFDKSQYRKLASVNKDLPHEFFAFCMGIGKKNMLPGFMVIDDDLADTFEAFYAHHGVPCDLRLPSKEVCQRAEADLLREDWMEKWVRKGRGIGGGVTGGLTTLTHRGMRMETSGTGSRVKVGG